MARMLAIAMVFSFSGCGVFWGIRTDRKRDVEHSASAEIHVEGHEIESVTGEGHGSFKLILKAGTTWK